MSRDRDGSLRLVISNTYIVFIQSIPDGAFNFPYVLEKKKQSLSYTL